MHGRGADGLTVRVLPLLKIRMQLSSSPHVPLDELRCKVAQTRAQARAIRARAEEAWGRNVELVTMNLERQCEALTLIQSQVEVHGELIRTTYAIRSIHIRDPANLRHKADVSGATSGQGSAMG